MTFWAISGRHNCIPISHWFRRRWMCIRCKNIYRHNNDWFGCG